MLVRSRRGHSASVLQWFPEDFTPGEWGPHPDDVVAGEGCEGEDGTDSDASCVDSLHELELSTEPASCL